MFASESVSRLPAEASRRRRPRPRKLAQQNNSSKMVGVVGSQAFQLLPYCHGPRGHPRPGRAAHLLVVAAYVQRDRGRLLILAKKALPQFIPAFARHIVLRRKPRRGVNGVYGLNPIHPIQRHLLPEGDMPQLLVDRSRRAFLRQVRQRCVKSLKNDCRRRCRAVSYQNLSNSFIVPPSIPCSVRLKPRLSHLACPSITQGTFEPAVHIC